MVSRMVRREDIDLSKVWASQIWDEVNKDLIKLRLKMDKIGSADLGHKSVSETIKKIEEAIFWWHTYRGLLKNIINSEDLSEAILSFYVGGFENMKNDKLLSQS